MYEPDESEIEEAFTSILSNLSSTKESITRATKFAMEFITYNGGLFHLIIKRMKKASTRRKLSLFYLIDSICQISRQKNRNEYIMLTAKYLTYLIQIMLYPFVKQVKPNPATTSPTNSDAATIAEKQQCESAIKKVLGLWESRNTLSIGGVPLDEVLKEGYKELQNPSYPKSPVRDTMKNKKRLADEDDVEEILRKIEESRRENKRLRWEARLRPEVDTPFGEFEEHWSKVTMDDVRLTIRDYDAKIAAMEGYKYNGPSPFSPTSSLSSPSPSPGTPYSPTVSATTNGNYTTTNRDNNHHQYQYHQYHHHNYSRNSDHSSRSRDHYTSSSRSRTNNNNNNNNNNNYRNSSSSRNYNNNNNNNYNNNNSNNNNNNNNNNNSNNSNSRGNYRNSESNNNKFTEPAPPRRKVYSPSDPTSDSDSDDDRRRRPSSSRRDSRTTPPPPLPPPPPFSAPSPKNPNELPEIFIWDLDETLIVLNSLINDEYAKSHNKKKDVAMEIGERMRVLLFRVLDDFMFYHELEPYDQVQFFPFLQQNDDGRDLRNYDFSRDMLVSNGKVDFKKLAYRYRVIQDMYSGNINIPALITQRLHGEIENLVNEIDKYTDGWIMEGKRALQWSSSKPNAINLLVTSGHLVATVAKMIFFQLNQFIPVQNLYGAGTISKRRCFNKIRGDFPRNKITVIADGSEEESLSKEFGFHFHKIRSARDLASLHSNNR